MKTEIDTARANGTAKTEALADAARDAAESTLESAQQALETIADAAHDRMERARQAIVERGASASAKLRNLAEEDLADTAAGRALADAARRAGRAADGLRGQDIRGLARSGAAFARRNPEVVVAGLAVAGFLLTRLLRSTAAEPAAEPAAEAPAARAKAVPARRKATKPRARAAA